MKSRTLKSDTLLLTTAAIWGFAFVAQRIGMDYLGPFAFNGIRFFLGSLSLLPLLMITREQKPGNAPSSASSPGARGMQGLFGGGLAGLVLFISASLQQVGLVYTTAGKAGFITGLYVVIVPVIGLFFGQKTGKATWIGAFLAASGLYLLSVTESFTIAPGDLLELIGAFFWAGHVLIIGWLSPRIHPLKLAFYQFVTCAILSLLTALIVESISFYAFCQAALPILYGGLLSVGVAYTLQVVAQRDARPSHAAVILSLEAVFAALGGWMVLGETLTLRGMTGCALMLAGMLSSQLRTYLFNR